MTTDQQSPSGVVEVAQTAAPVGTPSLEEAKAALVTATGHRSAVKAKMDAERAAVQNAFADRIREAEMAVSAARVALAAAESAATPDHPWEGKRVIRWEIEMWRFSSKERSRTLVKGIVRTKRPGFYPAGPYEVTHASTGTPLVLLLKKDGTTGLKAEALGRFSGASAEQQWHLQDDGEGGGGVSTADDNHAPGIAQNGDPQ